MMTEALLEAQRAYVEARARYRQDPTTQARRTVERALRRLDSLQRMRVAYLQERPVTERSSHRVA